MKYKILIISLLTFFITINVFSQTKTRDHARFNKITKDYVINKDGSLDYTYHKELKLISTGSFDSDYGETFIIYNPAFQDLKINESYTIRADGSKITTPKNAFNPGLPFSCTDCERYNGMKEMIITHTALEHQATIVLDYTIHTQAKFIKELMEKIDFVEYCPVSEYVVSVSVPNEIQLNYSLLNASIEPVISEKDGLKVYTWKLESLKQSSGESYLPSNQDLYPVLTLSTFIDMQRAIFAFVNQNAFKSYSLSESKNVLSDIVNDSLSKIEKILAIRNYVVENVHTNDINNRYNNYVLSPASITWESNCGNQAEKAILLTALLKEAGFQAIPVAMVDKTLHNSKTASLDILNYFAVKVFADNQSFIISPIEENNSPLESIYNDNYIYVLDAFVDRIQALELNPIDKKINLKGHYSFDIEGKADGLFNCSIDSKSIHYFSLSDNEKKAASVVSNLKGESKNVKLTKENLQFELKAAKINLTDMGSQYFSFELPKTTFGIAINTVYLPTKRTENVKCGKTDETYSYTITIPQGSTLVSKPVDVMIEKPFGKMTVKITNDGKGTLTVFKELKIVNDIITSADYSDFRKMMVSWNDENTNKIIFKK